MIEGPATGQIKQFKMGEGEDCLSLVVPFENLKTFRRCVDLFFSENSTEKGSDVTGFYLTLRGCFQENCIGENK